MKQQPYRVAVGGPYYDKREERAVLVALREKRISQGKFVRSFEEAWARYIGRRFAIAVNSGSSANLVATLALKEYFRWRTGDAVLVPALTFPTAVSPILQAGLLPVWVDVDRRGNITLEHVLRAVKSHRTGRIRGFVLVHSLGVPCLDAPKIKRWARRKGIAILEDACESHGARVGKKRAGAFGDISTTSFFVAHNMTTGEGGMVTTDDPKLAEISRSLREFGRRQSAGSERYVRLASGPRYDRRYAFDRLGYNLRMTDITASLGLVQLSKLEAMNRRRRRIVRWYRAGLRELTRQHLISLPDEPRGSRNTYYTFLITLLKMPPGSRTLIDVLRRLDAAGIETRPFMGGNLLRQKVFAGLGRPERYPGAEFLHRQSFFVGCHPLLTRAQVHYVCAVIRRLFTAQKVEKRG